jgi:hypothetical protein
MIGLTEQHGGKAGDDKIDPLLELMMIKKTSDDIQKHLEELDKCVVRLGVFVADDGKKTH